MTNAPAKKQPTVGRRKPNTGVEPFPSPPALSRPPSGYAASLADLKRTISASQRRVVFSANSEPVQLYWHIGHGILQRQAEYGWGAKVIDRLAHDLHAAFPSMKGFSRANLMCIRAFAEAWPDPAIIQQLVGQSSWAAIRCKIDLETDGRYSTKCPASNLAQGELQ